MVGWKNILSKEKVGKDRKWKGAGSFVATEEKPDIWKAEEGNGSGGESETGALSRGQIRLGLALLASFKTPVFSFSSNCKSKRNLLHPDHGLLVFCRRM